MIPPNELRICNIFYPINRNQDVAMYVPIPFIIKEISEIQVRGHRLGEPSHMIIEYQKFMISDISPIPLTAEILEKAGFKNNNRRVEFQNLEVKDGVASVYDPHVHASNTDFPCKYLHQLQNIYFALTGQELTLTL